MTNNQKIRACLDAMLSDRIRAFHAARRQGSAAPFDMERLKTEMLERLESEGLPAEDFTGAPGLCFSLSRQADHWLLIVDDYDEKFGPFQRQHQFPSQKEARRKVLDECVSHLPAYGDVWTTS